MTATIHEAELLARLQAQFGDMNVNAFLAGTPNNNEATEEDDDAESSIEEPTAEDLQAWQEAQFAKGRMRLETKEILDDAATARRRRVRSEKEEDKDWERVPAPELNETSIFFPSNADGMDLATGVHPLLQKLANFDPEILGTQWHCMYSSSGGDGVSFRNLVDKIRAYTGSTILLFGGVPSGTRSLGNTNNNPKQVSLGFFTFDTWMESEEMFGSDDECFLFALDYGSNDVKIFPSRLRGDAAKKGTKNFLYCNPSSGAVRSKKTDGSLHGLGFGGTPSLPRLYISETLEECRALSYDTLFEDGDLMLGKGSESLYYFDVNEIEVWAVGGNSIKKLAAQAKQKEIELANLEHARQVDKAQFLEHIENGFAWKSGNKPGLFGHRDSTR